MSIAKETMIKAYFRMQQRMADHLQQEKMSIFEMDAHEREKFIHATVMCLMTMECKEAETAEEAEKTFEVYDSVLTLMMALTPEQFERMFPIEKKFDGDRWGTKDYFFTKKIMDSLPKEEMLYKNITPFDLMWDYCNKTIRELVVGYMGAFSEIRKLQGKPSPLQEFLTQGKGEVD